MKLYLENTRVRYTCPNCGESHWIGPPKYSIVAGRQGIEVSPDPICRCGAFLRIKRTRTRQVGDVGVGLHNLRDRVVTEDLRKDGVPTIVFEPRKKKGRLPPLSGYVPEGVLT